MPPNFWFADGHGVIAQIIARQCDDCALTPLKAGPSFVLTRPYLSAILVRPLLFRCDPERTHVWAIGATSPAGKIAPIRTIMESYFRFEDQALTVDLCGMRLSNPIGLAAGYDKNGTAIDGFAAPGFGHLEIGSISIDPSAGNPKPRLFRFPEDRALVVCYGLQNDGVAAVADRFATRRAQVPMGANIVKTNRGSTRRRRPTTRLSMNTFAPCTCSTMCPIT